MLESPGWIYAWIDFSWWSEREGNAVSDIPLGQEVESGISWIEKHQEGRTGEERQGPDLTEAKMMCHQMSNAGGKGRN